jgi:hypothetical protein
MKEKNKSSSLRLLRPTIELVDLLFCFCYFLKKQKDYIQSLAKGAILRLLSIEPHESLNPAFRNERRGLFLGKRME